MRKILLFSIVLISGILFTGRLFYLQILDTSYAGLSANNAIKRIYDYPQRGHIYDRNGELLVSNQPSYDVMVIPREVKPFDTTEFCSLLKMTKEALVKRLNKARVYSPRLPSIVIPQLTKSEYAYLQEKMRKYEGFYIQKRSLRDYQVDYGANFLGYIAEVNRADIEDNPYLIAMCAVGTGFVADGSWIEKPDGLRADIDVESATKKNIYEINAYYMKWFPDSNGRFQ